MSFKTELENLTKSYKLKKLETVKELLRTEAAKGKTYLVLIDTEVGQQVIDYLKSEKLFVDTAIFFPSGSYIRISWR